MREIKFRAFNNNIMYSIVSINLNDNVAVGCSNSEWFEFDIENLMQYTGLKDKNGVDIYDGDIVMAPYMNKKPCIVKYSSVLAKFTMSDKFNFTAIDANLEVVGNIYENKELLN